MNFYILTLDATIKSFSVLATGIDVKYTYAYKSVHDVFSEASKGDMVVGYIGNPINQFRYVLEIEEKISEKECIFRKRLEQEHGLELIKSNSVIQKIINDNIATNPFIKITEIEYKSIISSMVETTAIELRADKVVATEEIVFETALENVEPRNRIVFGAPGTGKSFLLKEDCDALMEGTTGSYERVTFHPDYTYSQFVGAYKPIMSNDGESIRYDFVPGPFMRVYVDALKSARTAAPQPHLLLIEEINRAKVAAVFGDVFQLLDRDEHGVSEYEIQASEDIRRYLAKELNGKEDSFKKIRIPNNMFIWATMNSADQGVYPMDTAFKRRWNFEYLGINDKEDNIKTKGKVMLEGYGEPVVWNKLRRAINDKMSSDKFRINEDKLMGPYFLSQKVIDSDENGMIKNPEKFKEAFKSKVIMYLYEDAVKQRKNDFFDGCDSSKYSSVCEAFDKKGMGIFGNDFISYYYELKRNDVE